jgi:PAS domain S-box-containing protein
MGTLKGVIATALTPALERKLKSWDALLEQLPIGICICDAQGNLVRYNRRAAEIWGRAPEPGDAQCRFTGALRVYSTEGSMLLPEQTPMGELLLTGTAIKDREVIVERPNGSRATTLANLEPLNDDRGRLIGGVNCFQDISEHKRTQRRLRNGARILNDLLQALPAAVYTTDMEGRITFFNHAAVELWGHAPTIGTDLWCGSWRLYWPDGRPMRHDECPMAIALKQRRAIRGAEGVAERLDGTRVPFIPFPTPLHDASGKMIGAVNMLIDISERKRSELDHKALVDELNHRVKNTLATVQSLAAQTLRGTDTDLHGAFEGRLLALSRIHDRLSDERWESADLSSVLADVVAPYSEEGETRVRVSGEPVRLQPKIALTLALVFHELATNASKYGALSVPEGVVDAHWHIEKSGGAIRALIIGWAETGGPALADAPAKKGFGTRLVERSVSCELGGSVETDFARAGLKVTLRIPLGDRIPREFSPEWHSSREVFDGAS